MQTEPEIGSDTELRQQVFEQKSQLEIATVFNYLNPGDEGENVAYWLSQSQNSMTSQR